LGELLVAACGAAIARGSSGRQANYGSFHSAFLIEQQRAAKGAGFVVRMGG